jgi:4-aminobutyrate aminotransferase
MQTTTRVSAATGTALTAPDHLTPVLGRYFQRTWSHGEGHRLFDVEGRAYLDFANGIAVSSLGHHHPAVSAAIHAQVDRLIAPPNAIGFTEPINRLAEMIAAEMPDPLDTVFFLNSGSEAIEGALKMARRVTGRPGIIAFRGGFHGRTFGATSVTSSNPNYRHGYEPLLPGVYLAAFPDVYRDFDGDEDAAADACLAALVADFDDQVVADDVAAILVEPIQGEGGYRPAPARFLRALRRGGRARHILLIFDEVQSGYARTGKMWGFEHAGVVPDVVTLAKAIANGLPLAAVVSRRELQERWGRGAHGSTFGGNPVACAAGIAVLETIHAEELVVNAAARGAQLDRRAPGDQGGRRRHRRRPRPGLDDRLGPGHRPSSPHARQRSNGARHPALCRPRAPAAFLWRRPRHGALDRAHRRHGGRDQRGTGHLRRGAGDRLTALGA